MRALHWDGHELSLNLSYPTPQTSKIEDRESKIVGATASRPELSDERTALVKVHLAGICSTDLQIFKGYMDFQVSLDMNSSAPSLKDRGSSSISAWSVKSTSPAAGATIAILGLAATVHREVSWEF